jgi:hypothetical protein
MISIFEMRTLVPPAPRSGGGALDREAAS